MQKQRSLHYSKTTQAKKFFKKHPDFETKFKDCIISIAKNEKSISDFDIIPWKGQKNGFRFRKEDKRIAFIMTMDYKIIVIEVKEANNRGDMYRN